MFEPTYEFKWLTYKFRWSTIKHKALFQGDINCLCYPSFRGGNHLSSKTMNGPKYSRQSCPILVLICKHPDSPSFRIKFDADAVCRMSIQRVNKFQFRVAEVINKNISIIYKGNASICL